MDHVPGDHQADRQHQAGSMAMYLTVGGLSLVLTVIAFLLVWQSVPLRPFLLPIILILAAFQVALQTVLFMHLNLGRRLYSLFFGFGMAMALIIAGGVFLITDSLSPAPPPAAVAAQQGGLTGQGAGGTAHIGGGKEGKGGGAASAPPSQAQLVAMGQQIVSVQCQACHIIAGKGQTIGPDLDKVLAGQIVPGMVPGGHPTQQAWLVRWISNPQGVWPQAKMPNLGLTSTQVQAVVAYLLKTK
jgi:heme/copper-type cytochrome/quinol oxidase subunit 4/cytochrome c2